MFPGGYYNWIFFGWVSIDSVDQSSVEYVISEYTKIWNSFDPNNPDWKYRLDYVFYGPDEKRFFPKLDENTKWLNKVYEDQYVTIFKVLK